MTKRFLTVALALGVALAAVAETMSYEPMPLAPEWKLGPAKPLGAEAEWHEMEGGLWFTNAVGEKISVEAYCAAVNSEAGDEAAADLDARYARCDVRVSEALVLGAELFPPDESFWKMNAVCGKDDAILKGAEDAPCKNSAWRIAGDFHVLLKEDDSGRMRTRYYYFMLFDGKTARTVLPFEFMPDAAHVASILRARTNPDALNNVAAMAYNDYATHRQLQDRYVEELLLRAARAGSWRACENLAAYGAAKAWPQEKVARWREMARLNREAVRRGFVPKLEVERVSSWPRVWVND